MLVDFNSWSGSITILLFMGGLIATFSSLLAALLIRLGDDDSPLVDRYAAMKKANDFLPRKAA